MSQYFLYCLVMKIIIPLRADNTSVDPFVPITTAGVILALSVIFNFAILFGCLTLLASRFKAKVEFKATKSDIEEQSGRTADPVYEEVLRMVDPVVENNLCYGNTTAL